MAQGRNSLAIPARDNWDQPNDDLADIIHHKIMVESCAEHIL